MFGKHDYNKLTKHSLLQSVKSPKWVKVYNRRRRPKNTRCCLSLNALSTFLEKQLFNLHNNNLFIRSTKKAGLGHK